MRTDDARPISLFTFDELWDELKKRREHVVMVESNDLGDGTDATVTRWGGGIMAAVGLLRYGEWDILNNSLNKPLPRREF